MHFAATSIQVNEDKNPVITTTATAQRDQIVLDKDRDADNSNPQDKNKNVSPQQNQRPLRLYNCLRDHPSKSLKCLVIDIQGFTLLNRNNKWRGRWEFNPKEIFLIDKNHSKGYFLIKASPPSCKYHLGRKEIKMVNYLEKNIMDYLLIKLFMKCRR